jgi:hypothetical protein
VLLPLKSPNLNATLELLFGSHKSECVHRMILVGEKSMRTPSSSGFFIIMGNALDNRLIEPGAEAGRAVSEVECRERLGGLLNYYYRRAA